MFESLSTTTPEKNYPKLSKINSEYEHECVTILITNKNLEYLDFTPSIIWSG